jgi:tetratricopeptide (TPR) repeat protein
MIFLQILKVVFQLAWFIVITVIKWILILLGFLFVLAIFLPDSSIELDYNEKSTNPFSDSLFHKIEEQWNMTSEREYTFRGECKLQLEDYRGALNDFELALKENVEQSKPNIYNFIAETKLYLKDYLGAINEVNKCIQINGGNTMHIVDGILEKNNYYLSRAYLIRGLANHLINKVESACVDWSKSGELGEAEAYIYIKKYCNNR